MNEEFLHTAVSQEVLEQNLIAALTRLQKTASDSEFLDSKIKLTDELPPEPFLGFVIGGYSFIVKATCFCEVFVDAPIACVPNSANCFVGLSNIRGVLVPVYQLHASLNSRLPKKTTIFCIGKGDAAVGILIDTLPTSVSLSAQQRRSSVSFDDILLKSLVKSTYTLNETDWLLLDGNTFAAQLQALANQSHAIPPSHKNTEPANYQHSKIIDVQTG
ncbi:MAG: chemotaxis protein CheW [Cellvibrio sp.]